MTPMRDMRMSGPAVGWYLATTFLPKLVGLEEVPIPHVQGNQTTGHCYLRHEKQTAIVARPEELTDEHVKGRETVVLVDSVVNSEKSAEEFVQHIRALDSTIRIVVIADILARDENVGFVCLRLSDNKYIGIGTTDTGNQLFNSAHLE
ncbi:uracil phosphoribosyltransferase [Mycena leptocephala]|nr:uracil phosphoribosyltransferase [Mycena leptocephala]